VDCQNGIPFFSPAFAGRRVPVVQVVHHVHQDQFAVHFSRPMAAVGRFLERTVARRVYGDRAIAAVSPSTRQELRRQLGLRGPIFVVPNGTGSVPELVNPRDPDPTIAVVSRLVAHKRLDILLHHLALAIEQIPRLRVDIVGDGPELVPLRQLATDLGLQDSVTFHGRQPDAIRDAVLQWAWLTVSTSAGEGWGCAIVEAAAWGVPCLALQAPGVRDSVVPDQTGWLVDRVDDLGQALATTLASLADEDYANEVAARCQAWARCFTWERSAELLAGVVIDQVGKAADQRRGVRQRRYARSDITTLARHSGIPAAAVGERLRATDEICHVDGLTSILLGGCDEVDAIGVLERLGMADAELRLADRYDLLAGPQGLPAQLTPTSRLRWTKSA
jgi:glycosyltransferase involved in cell wall biosynthesis